MYYVAYGSNMDVRQMERRCPNAQIVGTGIVKNYKFVFDVHADIRKSKGDNVKVLVWDILDSDLESLDIYEGYPIYYIRKDIKVEMDDGYSLTGIVYLMTNRNEYFMPSSDYFNVISWSYDYWGFDKTPVYDALEKSKNYDPSPNYVCSICFNNASKCECKGNRHRHWIEIDKPLQKTIRILNEKGYHTSYCCSGHDNKDNLYIHFSHKCYSPECHLNGIMWNKNRDAMYYWYDENKDFKGQQKEFIKKLEEWAKNLKKNPYYTEENEIEDMWKTGKISYKERNKMIYNLNKKYCC